MYSYVNVYVYVYKYIYIYVFVYVYVHACTVLNILLLLFKLFIEFFGGYIHGFNMDLFTVHTTRWISSQ
jgi:hypothetical protein